jgi:hypothetical protein
MATTTSRMPWRGELAGCSVGFRWATPPSPVVTHTTRGAVRHLRPQLRAGDVVLIKGDVETQMEQVVEGLLADPADAARLVRRLSGLEVRVARPARPTWVEVDLEAVAYNVRQFKHIVGPEVQILAALKADAYGHGAPIVGRICIDQTTIDVSHIPNEVISEILARVPRVV